MNKDKKFIYFGNCKTIEEVKRLYKELALKYHPDKGGDTKTMQAINTEYNHIRKNPNFKFSEQSQEQQDEFNKYPEIIDVIVKLEGIIIELVGNWIWVYGNTLPHKEIFKELGFIWASKKNRWFYRSAEYKCKNHKPKSMDEIRSKYGSIKIETKEAENILEK